MDVAVRCLRDGRIEDAARVLLVVDDAQVYGGLAIYDRILQDTVAAISAGRSQAQRVHAVAIDRAPSELAAAGVHSITDCFTDPCDWLSASSHCIEQVRWNDIKALQQLAAGDAAAWAAAAGSSSDSSCSLIMAGLSTLLQRHPTMQILQLLHNLRSCPVVSSLLLSVHQDLHPPQVLAALFSLSNTVLQLHSVHGLQFNFITQATGKPCHGQLVVSSKRSKLGRLKVDQQLYTLQQHGGVEVHAAPDGLVVDARALVETAIGKQLQRQQLHEQHQNQQDYAVAAAAAPGGAGGAAEDLSKKLGSSMRLEVSDQERIAKAAVRLPYAHQGAGKVYQAGDARQYLPPAAGGFGPGAADTADTRKLGHILYVRDSEEEHDSDEDPDDDLDI